MMMRVEMDDGAAIVVCSAIGPTPARSDVRIAAPPLSLALRIRQIFVPGAGLWCIGQMA